MGWYLLKRLAAGAVVVLFVTIVVFIVTHVIGNPVRVFLPTTASVSQRTALEHQLGLDRPVIVQLGDYLAHAVRLDFGNSLWQGTSAMGIVLARVPASLLLVSSGVGLGILIGVPLGVGAALRPGKLLDRLTVAVSVFGLSLPQFWIGLLLIILFSVILRWLPPSGPGGLSHLIMPAVVLALPVIGSLALVVRSSMIDELNAQHVRQATAKGLPRYRIVALHAFKGCAIGTLTLAGWEFMDTLAGATVVVETVYAWPGVGFTAIQAIQRQDLVLLQAVVFVVAVMVVIINIAIDILYKLIDPRIRLAAA